VLGRHDGGEGDQRLTAFGTKKELTRCHADSGGLELLRRPMRYTGESCLGRLNVREWARQLG
jgi:hypothetical protein